jgi:hypothetical protein
MIKGQKIKRVRIGKDFYVLRCVKSVMIGLKVREIAGTKNKVLPANFIGPVSLKCGIYMYSQPTVFPDNA